jgi:uncharacterized protein YkwD
MERDSRRVRRFARAGYGKSLPALAFAAAALAACSGGGIYVPANHVAPSVTGSSSPSPGDLQASIVGTVVDLPYDGTSANPGYSVVPPSGLPPRAGSPIANALVFVGPQIVAGSTPPPAGSPGFARAVTDAHGTFRLTNAPTGNVAISIFAAAPHVAVLHADLALAGGANAAGPYFLTVPTAAESAWLVQENADRASFGIAPVGMDEATLEAGRYWAAFMQRNAYFAHCIPASSCTAGDTTAPPATYGPQDVDPSARFHYEHGFSGALLAENIAAGFPSWQTVDRAFMAEQSACPGGAVATCPFDESTGHFLNIVDAGYSWSGFGIVQPSNGSPYYAQEFGAVESLAPVSATLGYARSAPGLRF